MHIKKIFSKEFWTGQRLILLAFLIVHVIASYYYISYQNITFDEPQYIEYAKRWLKGKPERIESLDDSKSPVVAVCWIPRITRQVINPNYQAKDWGHQDQKEGRYIMILFSFLTAIYVYWWCKDLYGERGWILPLLLLLFEPLYLAFTTLITTDLACGAFLIALLYHYRKYVVLRSRKDFYLSIVFATVSAVTKQNMLFVLFLLPCLSLTFYFLHKENRSWSNKKIAGDVVLFVVLLLVGINIIYYFHRSFIPFGNYVFESNTLQNLQQTFSFLSWMPVPLPHAYMQSLDMIKAHSEVGAGTPKSTLNGVYLFGELRFKGGFWYYYLVLWFFKMPIGYILLFIASVPLFIRNFNVTTFAKHYMFLIIPALYYVIILSFFNQFQIGIRHLLLVYPLLFVGLGFLLHKLSTAKKQLRILTAVAISYSFISIAFYYPFIIPYTNEMITDKKMVYTKFVDSSIDYGQADSSITDFISANPGYKSKSPVPDTGKYAIVMSQVVNTYLRKDNPYNWYQKLKPKGLYRYVVLLYDVKQKDLVDAGFTLKKN